MGITSSEEVAQFQPLTKEERQAANEARRLAGAAIRAEARRAEGGGFSGFTPPASPGVSPGVSPKPPRREPRRGAADDASAGAPAAVLDESFHEPSLFAEAYAMHEGSAAVPCRHCLARFHPWRVPICRQHNSMWMDIPEPVDRDEFPEGGLYLCCGALRKETFGCSIGKHEARINDGDTKVAIGVAGSASSANPILGIA